MARRTLADIIDDVSERLGDSATFASRGEIRDWLADGYSRMVRDAQSPAQLQTYDVPPRVQYAVTYEWERQYIEGTTRKFTFSYQSDRYEATYLYEASQQADQTAMDWTYNVTHLHQLAHIGASSDTPYLFSIPRRHDLLSIWYDNDILLPISGHQLEPYGSWWDHGGLPSLLVTDWSHNEFDLYRVVTSNNQAYSSEETIGTLRDISGDRTYSIDADYQWDWAFTEIPGIVTGLAGLGRKVSGSLTDEGHWNVQDAYTYPWERQYVADVGVDDTVITIGLGLPRSILSPDRQYYNGASWQRTGTIRSWGSSDDNLLVYSCVVPEREISEEAALELVPAQLEKYIIYYALWMIHSREGELYEPMMAQHYQLRYRRGVTLLSRIRDMAYRDTTYSRGRDRLGKYPRTPQLPDNYPILRLR